MSNNTLKLLAQKAKKRLSTVGQNISEKHSLTAGEVGKHPGNGH